MFLHLILFFTSEHNRSKRISTSGAFLNDLLTPAVRFSPWVTPLLGPIAPMVSSDDCRALTGIPVTQTTSESALWPLRDSAPYTLYSHWVSHTYLKVISKDTQPFNSLEGLHNTVMDYSIPHTHTHTHTHIWQRKWKLLLIWKLV